MRLEHLEYLITVADLGSISAAALALHISQPSLSAAIANIEEEYNLQIFFRTRAGVKLTDRGKLFLQKVRAIVRDANELKNFSGITLSGTLKVASVPGVNSSIMPAAVASFSSKYPMVSIEIAEEGSHAVKRAVDDNSVSVGLCSTRNITELDNGNYIFHKLFNGRVMVCLPPTHPLASNKEISVKMLNGYSLVIFNKSFRMYTHIISMLKGLGSPQIILTTSNHELASKVIIETNSVGFFSNVLLSNDHHIKEGKLIALPLVEEEDTTFITLQRREHTNNSLAREFVKEIRQQAKIFSQFNGYLE